MAKFYKRHLERTHTWLAKCRHLEEKVSIIIVITSLIKEVDKALSMDILHVKLSQQTAETHNRQLSTYEQ